MSTKEIDGATLSGQGRPEKLGDRALKISRVYAAPIDFVYRAFSVADQFRSWWVPRSVPGLSLLSCDLDVRTGGKYRLEFRFGDGEPIAFHGRYISVVPNATMVWTNDEEDDGGVTTVSFTEMDGGTLLTYSELFPTSAARDEALDGSAAALPEQLAQLGDFLTQNAR